MTETIVIKKKDHSFLQIETDAGVARELSDYFSFFVEGYRFMPNFRNKMWDGKIRLYNSRSNQIYTGLFNAIVEFAKSRGYKVNAVEDEEYGYPDSVDASHDVVEFIKNELTLTSKGQLITPRDYQLNGIIHALTNRTGVLLSPTASGKSLIIYILLRYFLHHYDKKVLIIVPTTSLVEQMYGDFNDYSSQDDGFNETDVHKIYGGADRHKIKPRVVVSTWQSIHRMGADWFNEYGMIIGDECHGFKAKSLTNILEKCTEAPYRIGCTGTLDGSSVHQLVLEGLFGPVYKVTTTKKLIDGGALAELDISLILLKYGDDYRKAVAKATYQQEVDFLVSHHPRNKFITNLACDQKGNTLVLFQYVERHGKVLYDAIKTKSKHPVYYISGETDTIVREQIRHVVESNENSIIVASMGTFSTGINIVNLHNIIFASPSKSQIRVLQSIGRGLRKSANGEPTKVFDIADDLCWKKKHNYTFSHCGERIKIYSKEQFNYNIYPVDLKT